MIDFQYTLYVDRTKNVTVVREQKTNYMIPSSRITCLCILVHYTWCPVDFWLSEYKHLISLLSLLIVESRPWSKEPKFKTKTMKKRHDRILSIHKPCCSFICLQVNLGYVYYPIFIYKILYFEFLYSIRFFTNSKSKKSKYFFNITMLLKIIY